MASIETFSRPKLLSTPEVEVHNLCLREIDEPNTFLFSPVHPAGILRRLPELGPDHIGISQSGLSACRSDQIHQLFCDNGAGVGPY